VIFSRALFGLGRAERRSRSAALLEAHRARGLSVPARRQLSGDEAETLAVLRLIHAGPADSPDEPTHWGLIPSRAASSGTDRQHPCDHPDHDRAGVKTPRLDEAASFRLAGWRWTAARVLAAAPGGNLLPAHRRSTAEAVFIALLPEARAPESPPPVNGATAAAGDGQLAIEGH